MIPSIYLDLAVTSCDRAVAFVAKFSHINYKEALAETGSIMVIVED